MTWRTMSAWPYLDQRLHLRAPGPHTRVFLAVIVSMSEVEEEEEQEEEEEEEEEDKGGDGRTSHSG